MIEAASFKEIQTLNFTGVRLFRVPVLSEGKPADAQSYDNYDHVIVEARHVLTGKGLIKFHSFINLHDDDICYNYNWCSYAPETWNKYNPSVIDPLIDTGWKHWTLADSSAFFEEKGFYRVRNGILYLRGTIMKDGPSGLIQLITFAELGITKENLDIPDFPNRVLTSFQTDGKEYTIDYDTNAITLGANNATNIECVIDGVSILIN